jgi:hypothetical protein
MHAKALVGLVLLAAAFVPMAAPAQAGLANEPLEIDEETTITGADTYMFLLRVDPSQGDPDHFEIAEDSYFNVTGHFSTANGSAPQDLAGMQGVVQYNTGLDCEPADDSYPDPCHMVSEGVSIKDTQDVRVEAGPFTFEQDPDYWGYSQATASIAWEEDNLFEMPRDADQLTVRFFITIPGADWIDVEVHVHSPQELEIYESIANDGGFLATGEDFDATAGVDTMPASAMAAGQETVELDGADDRLYAGFGPSWYGTSATPGVALSHNTAAVSNIAYEDPAGERISGTAYGVGSWSGILVPGSDLLGTHTFEVDAHAGVGPQDLYLVGYEGPTGG